MPYLGICLKTSRCGICKEPLKVGDRCYHDATKLEANALAHEKCWVDLRTKRGYTVSKKVKTKVKSKIPLDPPF